MVFMLKSLSILGSSFDAEVSLRDSRGGAVRIWGKECADSHFTFKIDAFVGAERLDEVEYDALDVLFKGG